MTCAETQAIGWAREHRYYHLLKPWVHYVPVREYLEDLVPQVIPPCSHTSETVTHTHTHTHISLIDFQ